MLNQAFSQLKLSFSDHNMGWIVSAGFALVIGLFLSSILAGIYIFNTHNQKLINISIETNRKAVLTFIMRDAIKERVDILRTMLTTPDPFDRDKLKMAFFSQASAYSRARGEFLSKSNDLKELGIIRQLDKKAKLISEPNAQALKKLSNLDVADSNDVLQAVTISISGHLSLLNHLEKFIELQQTVSNKTIQSAEIQHHETIRAAIIFSVIAILIAIATAWLVIRRASAKSRQLSHQASHDMLTQLTNRSAFEKALSWTLNESISDGSTHTLLFMDLDQFKIINDTKGHQAGDLLLKVISERLSNLIRSSDLLARLGGDEFGVLLRYTTPEYAEVVANKLCKSIESLDFEYDCQKFKVGVSIGMTPFNGNDFTLEKLLSTADSSCYVAKDAGRNRVHRSDVNPHEIMERSGEMYWVSRINEAITKNEFLLHGQIMQSLSEQAQEDRILVELLIRLPEESGELVLPEQFLPAAERYGQMTDIDCLVVKEALKWVSGLGDVQARIRVGINIFGRSASDPNFADFLFREIVTSKVDPQALCFEITESVAVNNLPAASALISQISRLGCTFALDDFGAGLSSFGYLRDLDVDYLKIDGSFVQNIETHSINRSLVASINDIAQTLGKITIAEFVENESSLEILRSMGLDIAQGFVVHHPSPLTEVEASLRKQLLKT